MLAPRSSEVDDRQGVLVRCQSCSRYSINLVTAQHLDVPFYNDSRVLVVGEVMPGDELTEEERFRHALDMGLSQLRWADSDAA
jgi:hypothetical protein